MRPAPPPSKLPPRPHLCMLAGGTRAGHRGAQVPQHQPAVHAGAHGNVGQVAGEGHRLGAAVLHVPLVRAVPAQRGHHAAMRQRHHLGVVWGGGPVGARERRAVWGWGWRAMQEGLAEHTRGQRAGGAAACPRLAQGTAHALGLR